MLGVDDARKQALEALRRLHAGEDPKAPRQRFVTLAEALEAYLASRKLQPSSEQSCRGVIEHHGAQWLNRPTTALAADAIARQYREIAASSVSQANKLLRNLSAVLRHSATATGSGDSDVIAKARLLLGGVEALAARDVTIPERLQRAWFWALGQVDTEARRLLLALALTGCRREELRAAGAGVWDPEARQLRFATTKNGRPHALPVGPYLAELLGGAGDAALFEVSETSVRAAYKAVGNAIGQGFTCHDLRRTFATTATRLGLSEPIVKQLLNHAAEGVTQKHYVRLSAEDLRPAMLAIENRLIGLWGVTA